MRKATCRSALGTARAVMRDAREQRGGSGFDCPVLEKLAVASDKKSDACAVFASVPFCLLF